MQNSPSISIIIPVFNEDNIINRTLAHIKNIRGHHNIEIIVVDGTAESNTINSISDKEVIKIVSSKGRARQMNLGAEKSGGDILLFLHADTILPDRAFDIIYNAILKNNYQGGAFTLAFDNDRFPFKIISFGTSLRCRLAKLPFGDQAIFISKEYFDQIGKYKDIPIMEDFELLRRIRKAGGRIYISGERVITSARKWEKEGIIKTSITNWKIQMFYLTGVPPEKLVNMYYKKTAINQ